MRWQWLYEQLYSLPILTPLQIDMPQDVEPQQYIRNMRGVMHGNRRLGIWRWSIRRTTDGKHILITKLELWPEVDQMIKNGMLAIMRGK